MHEEVVQVSRQEQRHEARENKRNSRRQHHNEPTQQNDVQNNEQSQQAVPRRDRRNQPRQERPNRHRDPSVLNEQASQTVPAVVEAPAVDDKQLRVELVDAPRQDVMPTAMVVNIDQAKSEIVALNDNAAVVTPAVEVTAPADAPVEEAAAENVVEATLTAVDEKAVPAEISAENHVPATIRVSVVASNVNDTLNSRQFSSCPVTSANSGPVHHWQPDSPCLW